MSGRAIAIRVEDRGAPREPLVPHRYQSPSSKTLRGGCCVVAVCRTDAEGTATAMLATRDPAGPRINPQNGKLPHPRVAPLGAAPALTAGETRLPADCFAVTAQVWTGLLFDANDGSRVRYKRAP